ncbi:vacuolar protein [Ceratobasidium sp. AG-Ba]|nr:vacuolar protein [Ceratobasidium sp. AG-Ba]
MIAETWFQDLVRKPTDLFLLAGHMSVVNQQGWDIVQKAIREHHPETPIAILGGHTHLRFCRQYDEYSMALESGRFMETVGIKMNRSNNSSISFSRKYLDANRRTYMYHTNTTEHAFDTKTGAEIDAFTNNIYNQWELGTPHGCSPENYYVDRVDYSDPQNIQNLYANKVIHEVVVRGWNRSDVPYVFIANIGMIRFDIYRGPFTWNDQLTVLPFKDGYTYITLPWSIARNVKDKLFEYPSDHFDAKTILTQALGHLMPVDEPRDQQTFSLSEPEPTLGYVTDDLCGGNGDDTKHARIPKGSTPEYYSNDLTYQLPDDHPVDLIIPDFLKPRTIVSINKLSTEHVYTLDDMLEYGTVKTKEGIYPM